MLIKRINLALLALVIMTSAGCGFKLQRSYSIPAELEELHLRSNDQYSELTRLVNERLRIHRVATVPASDETPTLSLINDSLERATLSLYPTGNVAEYELIYVVNYAVMIPGSEPQRFVSEIRRDYQDDPRTALAKSREMEMLVKEMRIQAADNIIQTLASIEVN
ncbi:LPS assembly lipoprotein LptE [Shewanella sp. 3_MG-2023]|uniref:LPS-assembly lipoprotein LptE n=1 Tax=Shewanella sp. 3_MG-2023 TaxID=3062635 RepID=UPI0026E1B252|nr:LPS assembly lipoprotein LptE [Shewanella sp. 3_MG-2023]MDO6773984.1 LPS assembly lipoprotein LptE [Shewanella sp. 3_MG-2023]